MEDTSKAFGIISNNFYFYLDTCGNPPLSEKYLFVK